MPGSYGASVFSFTDNLRPVFKKSNFLQGALYPLTWLFLKDFWDFLLEKTSCFTFLKITKEIGTVYNAFKINITFNSLTGCFITMGYKSLDYIKIYRMISGSSQNKAKLATILSPVIKS